MLDSRVCYRALRTRDRRFDGRFFTAVRTTGVYCRPICPARTPRSENVSFYSCAAAAERAGFRPCRRCRPESSPGTPAWIGVSATVNRALRLISQGAMDGRGVEPLAARVGVSARHLRRLFQEEMGANPAEIAQLRRVHFALRLLLETDLPVADVALAAGFRSVRRFNEAVRERAGEPPSSVRVARRRPVVSSDRLSLSISFRPPFDWGSLAGFLQERAIPGVEEAGRDFYRRTFGHAAPGGIVEVRPIAGESRLAISLPVAAAGDSLSIVERIRRVFDCGADPLTVAAHLRKDPLLAPSVRRHPGLRVPGAWDAFELAVRAILGQQVTVKGAATLAGRLADSFGDPIAEENGPLLRLFPTPERLAAADFSRIGLPRKRAETIRALSRAFLTGEFDAAGNAPLKEIVERLTAIPGIGEWTAHYIAMRAFSEPDAFPAADLGLRRAFERAGLPASRRQIETRSRAWSPWRAYAVMHLWASLSKGKEQI